MSDERPRGGPGAPAPPRSPRQARMGPAPFASFEESFDEADSPDEKPIIRLPEISEDETPRAASAAGDDADDDAGDEPKAGMESLGPQHAGTLQTPSTPRIDISRASSSSHHDSRDSSPENAIFGIGECIGGAHDPEGAKLGLGFREDGAADLRSSTEELAFLEPGPGGAAVERESSKQPSRRSPLTIRPDDQHHRKDSQCSDIVLLSISGRTSRLSSIGSQGSAHSGVSNVSHVSGQSRLSVISGVSRSPSPHKMLLETSFCGPKPLDSDAAVDKNRSEALEHALLSRKHDPKEAILAEVTAKTAEVAKVEVRRTSLADRRNSRESNGIKAPRGDAVRKPSLTSPVITVSTLGASYKNEAKPKPVKTETPPPKSKPVPAPAVKKAPPTKSAKTPPAKTSVSSGGTEYIRIRLKPDHMYDDESDSTPAQEQQQNEAMQKPATLNLSEHSKKNTSQHYSQIVKRDDSLNKITHETTDVQISSHSAQHGQTLAASPKQKSARDNGSRTPSPAGKTPSRKSSFCSLFKSRETIASPESPTGSGSKRKGTKDGGGSTHGSRSRSKSRERDKSANGTPTSAGKSKGSVLAIFKPSRKSSASSSPVARESLPNLETPEKRSTEGKVVPTYRPPGKEKLKYYDDPVDGFIRIPLHTPSDEEPPPPKDASKEKGKAPITKPKEESIQQIKVERQIDRPVSAPSSSRPSFSQPVTPGKSSKKEDSRQVVLADGIIRIPLHSPSEDRLVRCDLLPEEEVEEIKRRCSNISTKKSSALDRSSAGSGVSSSTDVSKTEEKVFVEPEKKKTPTEQIVHAELIVHRESTVHCEPIVHSEPAVRSDVAVHSETIVRSESSVRCERTPSEPESTPEQSEARIDERPSDEKLSSQAKKHIIFTTKVGSKDQLFSMQFSLSKTDSQCSQMSDNKSQISEESVIEVQVGEKRVEEPLRRTPSAEKSAESDKSSERRSGRNSTEPPTICTCAASKSESKDKLEPKESAASAVADAATPARNPSLAKTGTVESRSSVLSEDTVHDSSESERDSELDFIRKKQLLAMEKAGVSKPEPVEVDAERKNLVLQQESFDDELPYVPTTLPQERSVALPMVPIRQRLSIEVRTCPIERPRSTTPINPSHLEEYCAEEPAALRASERRLKISLPTTKGSTTTMGVGGEAEPKAKSPRRTSAAGPDPKAWFEFAEQAIVCSRKASSVGQDSDSDPPPLPPRATASGASAQQPWVNFENIPERRKAPKRIQTIPRSAAAAANVEPPTSEPTSGGVQYAYVNPEDCKCECHESGKELTPDEDEEPLLDEAGDGDGLSAPPLEAIAAAGRRPERRAESSQGYYAHRPTVGTPRIGVAYSKDVSSNRSSMASQDADRSSSSGSPNDVPPRKPPRSP